MADTSKAQRLSAAKKKVKEYQKNRKSKSDTNTDTKASVESLTNSTHSSLNEVQNLDENEIPNQSVNNVSPLQQYFTSSATVFDNINVKKKNNDLHTFDSINYNASDPKNKTEEVCINDEFHKIISNVPNDGYTYDTDDVRAIEDPEIEPNEIYNRLNANIRIGDNIQVTNKIDEFSSVHDPLTVTLTPSDLKSSKDDVNNVQENMQSLKQLSTQIIQMIDDNGLPNMNSKSNSELGSKSNEISSFLQMEQEKNKQLLEEILMNKTRIEELENESQNLRENNGKYEVHLKQLTDQMNYYEKRVILLECEKDQLGALASQNSESSIKSTRECEELKARLKTSRSRVADLEKELNILRAEKNDKHVEQNEHYQKLLNECESLRNQREETLQDVSELQQKLNTSTSENLKLKNEVQELTSQLSLLNIKLQQLSSGVDQQLQFNGHVEGLTQQINMFEKQVIDLNNVIKTLTIEKEQTSVQYQQYVQQLNAQLNTFAQKLEEKNQENEVLVSREQQLTNQMGELEKLLQKLQSDQQVVINNKSNNDLKKDLEESLISLKAIQEEKSILEETYQLVISERDDAFKELQLKKEEMSQLEEEMNRLESNQPDSVKLLAAIESDKVAASRAVAQNTELKKQLEEMQQAFIQISNNKLELTEMLSDQKHKNKELNDKLNQFESQVHTLTDAIEIKDREMVALRESAQELNKYVVQQNQLEDRLRHYEAHDHSTHALQHELQDSYKKIQNLRSENETLKFHLKNSENKNKELESLKSAPVSEGDTSEDKAVLLSRINDLERRNKEMEFHLLQMQNAELNKHSTETDTVTHNPSYTDGNSGDEIKSDEYINQHLAMKQLEEKFTKTMQDIADLEDEKQRLEHLVMQLQDETETIGEYVTLYQHQRGILKQRALERDEQMRQLTVDREQMKIKIDQLNELVKTLILEKGIPVSPEIINQHLSNKVQLCDEHAKKSHENLLSPVRVNNNNNKTAEKIIELLSDIKTSNLVQPSETTETFHPCPWCSGQLITV